MKEKIRKILYATANILLTIAITLTGILLVLVIVSSVFVSLKGDWAKKITLEESRQNSEKIGKIFEEMYNAPEKNAGKN